MNLVVIQKDIYSFYSEGEHVISVQSHNMEREDVEFYRQNLDILVAEANMAALADVDPNPQLEFDF